MFGRAKGSGSERGGGDDADLAAVVPELSGAVIAALTVPERGVHIDTALAGIAATAGAFLLRRHVGGALDTMAPGSPVLVDSINDEGPELLELAQRAAAASGLAWDPTGGEVPEDNQPHEPHVELVRRLEPALAAILQRHGVDPAGWPTVTLLAAVDLMGQGRAVIDSRLAARIVTWSLVVGAKTVPYPVPPTPPPNMR